MNTETYAETVLAALLARADAQFGSAIRGFWFYRSRGLSRLPGRHYRGKVQGTGGGVAQCLHLPQAGHLDRVLLVQTLL